MGLRSHRSANLQFNRSIAVGKLVRFDSHPLSHQQQEVAHVGIAVCRTTAKSVVFVGLIELVAVEVSLVEIQVTTVLESKL